MAIVSKRRLRHTRVITRVHQLGSQPGPGVFGFLGGFILRFLFLAHTSTFRVPAWVPARFGTPISLVSGA
ncbi:Hypothetical protein SCLAV_2192 [Streptomyces clavuligerus]|uniref:Uncharacterized protein n=1 Tax=Streptomyces clavuligerus TaxID=1901 RepID=E2Q6E1_STRCL|nr:Hypothetical protein SCLAV_2192 [Streptomyces clavuligerus]